MPRCLTRISLALILMLSGEVWALGLGEVRLESALNEPLRAEIELLAASPEELVNLRVAMASTATFERYGIDRPFYLQDIQFDVVRSGRADGNFIRVRSATPMSEPFLTFLVEATWSRGRLLREYTVLLDPPTFAPPAATQPQVSAPQQAQTGDSGRIERAPAPAPAQPTQTRPAPAPTRPAPAPAQSGVKPQPIPDDTPYDTGSGGGYSVNRGDTLWGIARASRPDSRLTMNQTMLAIYEMNRSAFDGNINRLREGASLNIPSADDIYNIDRVDANSEVQRQHVAWGGAPGVSTTPDTSIDSRPSLTLVPPDDDPVGVDTGADADIGTEPVSREQQIEDRIFELEAADVPIQQSLIDIRNNELAALRGELAEIRGEVYEPPVDDPFVDDELADDEMADDEMADDELADDELFPDFDDVMTDDSAETGADDATAADDTADTAKPTDPSSTISRRQPEPSFIDKAMGYLKNVWVLTIGGALLLVMGLLFWFIRRGAGGEEPDAWGALDADEGAEGPLSGTESMRAPTHDDESIMVVEQETILRPPAEDTMEIPQADTGAVGEEPGGDIGGDTGSFDSLEDTFSSDTAINLDQSDPIAEADFHMAYGLYDQAADLINGALQIEPKRQDLLTKLCEIYFVWGNRDAFVDASERLQSVTGGSSADWDKIVIMGQQIAGDNPMFAGAGVVGATKEVDLSFEAESDDTGALDMDFGEGGDDADIIDLGADFGGGGGDDDAVDFLFDETAADSGADATSDALDFSVTEEMPTVEQSTTEPTVEMPSADATAESPTIEDPFGGLDGTAELPSIPDSLEDAIDISGQASDATAEIDLHDLGLDLGDLDETEVASLDDLDATGTNETLADPADITGKNQAIDPSATGVQEALDTIAIGLGEPLNLDDELAETGEMRLAADETGQNPMMDPADSSVDLSLDDSLLDATGHTQIISDDLAVETITEEDGGLGDGDATTISPSLGADDATMLAPMDDEEDFDFAKTEALPPGAYTGDSSLDETGELPAVASTDVDLDLDDLTAALKVSEMGDTVDMPRDDATVEQPRPSMSDDETAETLALTPSDMSDDLAEARTMTEVGTKLDLARAYVDMGDPAGARSILDEVLDEGDEAQRQQAQQLMDSLPS